MIRTLSYCPQQYFPAREAGNLFLSSGLPAMKRKANEISSCSKNSQEQTLEEAIYEYIERNQEWEDGKGVGISCDHLNNNITHAEKPHGKGSEKKLIALMHEMPSLIQSETKWNGKIVIQLNETQPELDESQHQFDETQSDLNERQPERDETQAELDETQLEYGIVEAKKLLTTATHDGWSHLHDGWSHVNISREQYMRMLEDIMAANDFLTIAEEAARQLIHE